MLTFLLFKWRPLSGYETTYNAWHVNAMAAQIARHYPHPHEVVCVTDDAEGIAPSVRVVPLWDDLADVPAPRFNLACYRRLVVFSREAPALLGLEPGSSMVWMDLDALVVGSLDGLGFGRRTIGLLKDEALPGCNGSLVEHRLGSAPRIYDWFDRAEAARLGRFGCDQGWLSQFPAYMAWDLSDGLVWYKTHRQRWGDGGPPEGTRIVFFHGPGKPWDLRHSDPWIDEHYRSFGL